MRPGAALIARPSLVERLIESDAPLVVICAPAGYGKTTLVRQWAAEDERPFAWLKTVGRRQRPGATGRPLDQGAICGWRNLAIGGCQPSLTLARRGVRDYSN